jgi:hypothetical protein
MFRRKDTEGSTRLEGGALSVAAAINLFYPVGSLYITTVATNPGTGSPAQFPGTTWAAWGAGRAVVGVGSNGINTYTVEQTFGADSCTLTAAQCGVNTHTHSHTLAAPSHTHTASTDSQGDHIHQPGTPLDSSWGFLSFLQGGTVARRQIGTGGTGQYVFSVTTVGDVDYANATNTDGAHTHSLTSSGPSATALTGAMGAISGASGATSHDIRNSSIATYIWKRTA